MYNRDYVVYSVILDTDRQTDRQTDRHTHTHTHTNKHTHVIPEIIIAALCHSPSVNLGSHACVSIDESITGGEEAGVDVRSAPSPITLLICRRPTAVARTLRLVVILLLTPQPDLLIWSAVAVVTVHGLTERVLTFPVPKFDGRRNLVIQSLLVKHPVIQSLLV